MDLTIVEHLVCPESHAAAPLVVRADDVAHGRMTRGLLGCPQCRREWPVTDGIARLGARAALAAIDIPDAGTVAALLSLTEPGIVIVDGAARRIIDALAADFGATVVALDAADPVPCASVIDGAARVPLGAGVARGALLLRPGRDAAFVASAARAVAPGGRVVGAAALDGTDTLREIARDAQYWVSEPSLVAAPVPLRRRTK